MAPRYHIGEIIARGGFGTVYKCHDARENLNCVMKVIPFESNDNGVSSSVIREISVLREMLHPNVVRLLDVYDDQKGFHLIFELMELDLHKFINGPRKTELTPDLIKTFLYQILQAVKCCHCVRVMHRDLNPYNLLVDIKGRMIKLADFGLTRTFDVPLAQYSTDVVAHSYKAPELLLGTPYTRAVDIWSVGCIFAEMVGKYVLFGGKDEKEVMRSIMSVFGKPDEKDWPGVTAALIRLYGTEEKIPNSPVLGIEDVSAQILYNLTMQVPELSFLGVELLSKMLCVNPKDRITAYDALQHPYFKNVQK